MPGGGILFSAGEALPAAAPGVTGVRVSAVVGAPAGAAGSAVPDSAADSSHAASKVWPWLVQVGCLRGGFYSNDLLDNLGHPSARTILPELQHLRVGQWVPMSPGTPTVETAFTVAGLDVDRWLLWSKPDGTWAWKLTGLDNGTTRLVTRVHAVYDWRKPALALLGVVLMEFGDFAMMRRMLLGIKERAETVGRGQHPTPTTPSTRLSRPKTVRPQKAPMPGPRAWTVDRATSRPSTPRRSAKRSPSPSIPAT